MNKQKFPPVDPKSFELAKYFLSDLEGDEASEWQIWELAENIQDAVELWFQHSDALADTAELPK